MESHGHLLFQCTFEAAVCHKIRLKCGCNSHALDLTSELNWGIRNFKRQSLRHSIYMLYLTATITLLVWKESNCRTFEQIVVDSAMLEHRVMEEVKACVFSLCNLPF